MKIMTVFGTRPEVIKLAPVIQRLQQQNIGQVICSTGQHRQMLDQMLDFFEIQPDVDIDIMQQNQTLIDISTRVLDRFTNTLQEHKPTAVIVQGDTSTAFMAGLCAFYQKIPVYHVEAGLRTGNIYDPFPEEMNRMLIGQLASLHFAPTKLAVNNLLASGVKKEKVALTGNTVIDALMWAKNKVHEPIESKLKIDYATQQTILLTTHRRENLETGMDNIFKAVRRLLDHYPDLRIVFPIHLNPVIRDKARKYFSDADGDPGILSNNSRLIITEPLTYSDMIYVLQRVNLVMTDSGGLQEEAPAFGKPVVVLRHTTERPEGVDAGTAVLVGTEEEAIYKVTSTLLSDASEYQKMANAVSPYGDGRAAEYIVDRIMDDQRT